MLTEISSYKEMSPKKDIAINSIHSVLLPIPKTTQMNRLTYIKDFRHTK